jgi:GTP cyclohydrolase IA
MTDRTPIDPDALPVSASIRARIEQARHRYHANDNIAAFLRPGELEALIDEVEAKMRGVLQSLVIDIASDHNTQDTARRVAKMYLTEVFRGRYVPAPPVTEFPNAEHLNELMIVGPLWIGVMPNEHSNLIGLSKYARLAEWIMGRPQIQEEAITQMADMLMNKVSPDGLAVVMEADHFCMHWRGVKDDRTKMVNSVMRGSFLKDPALRREFLSLISLTD